MKTTMILFVKFSFRARLTIVNEESPRIECTHHVIYRIPRSHQISPLDFDKIEFITQNTSFYFDPNNPISKSQDANLSKGNIMVFTR